MKHQYIEAPYHPIDFSFNDWGKSVFLGGSITGARNWQNEAADKLLPHFHVFNPRRANFDVLNPGMERQQITWEHTYLDKVEIMLFYFSFETMAPITLLEYGAALESSKTKHWQHVYASIHPDYKRKNDVIIQTELRNPEWSRNITHSLDDAFNLIISNHADKPKV